MVPGDGLLMVHENETSRRKREFEKKVKKSFVFGAISFRDVAIKQPKNLKECVRDH